MEIVNITTDTGAIEGTLVLPPEDVESVASTLLVHGWSSNRNASDVHLAERLANLGLLSLAIDLPGHGSSSGDRNILLGRDYIEAVKSAYNWLASRMPSTIRKIIGIGASFGSYLIVRASTERSFSHLVLRVPANYDDVFDGFPLVDPRLTGIKAKEWRAHVLPPDSTAAMRALRDFRGEVLVLEAERDEFIPRESVLNLTRSVNSSHLSHLLIARAPHIMYQNKTSLEASTTAVCHWLCNSLGIVKSFQSIESGPSWP